MKVIEEKKNIYQILKQRAFEKKRLFQVQIDITHACDAHCNFCFQGNTHCIQGTELTLDEYDSIFRQLKEMGVLYIAISGGEPFYRNDAVEIIKLAKKYGFLVTIVTNLHIPDEGVIEELASSGISRVTVSFHSINPQNYARIFGVPEKLYYSVLKKIDSLKSKGCSVGIAVTVTKDNFYEIHDIKKFFVNMGIEEQGIGFNMLLKADNDVDLRPSVQDIKNVLHYNDVVEHNIVEKLPGSYSCTAGHIYCVIDPYGEIKVCPFMYSSCGNIRKETIKNVWEKSALLKILRDINCEESFLECIDCENNKTCQVCMATNLNETGHYNVPSKDYCAFRKQISYALGVIECEKNS